MKRSAKNYLLLGAGLLSLYFMAVGIVSANEDRTTALMITNGIQPGSQVWKIILIGVCGCLACVFFALLALSKNGRKPLGQVFHSIKGNLVVLLSAISGAGAALLMAMAMIGSLPEFDFTPKEPTANVVDDAKSSSHSSASSSASSSSTSASADSSKTEETSQEKADLSAVEQANALYVVEDAQTITATIEPSEPGQSAVAARDLSSVTLSSSSINKTGDTASLEQTRALGINAAVLGGPGSTMNMLGSVIRTDAVGAPGIALSGENASASVTNCDVTTIGGTSPLFFTDNGGTIHMTGGLQQSISDASPIFLIGPSTGQGASSLSAKTSGPLSPIFENKGSFSAESLDGTTANSPAAIMYPASSTTLTNCTLASSGFEEISSTEGIFLFTGENKDDKNADRAEFAMNGSSVSLSDSSRQGSCPIFSVSNVNVGLILGGNTGFDTFTHFLQAKNSIVEIGSTAQNISGSILLDSDSELRITLTGSSVFSGSLNADNASKNVSLHMDTSSKFVLSEDTYLSELVNDDASNSNIQANGHSLYVNGEKVL